MHTVTVFKCMNGTSAIICDIFLYDLKGMDIEILAWATQPIPPNIS